VRDLAPGFVRRCQQVIEQRLAAAAERGRISPETIPVIAVGAAAY